MESVPLKAQSSKLLPIAFDCFDLKRGWILESIIESLKPLKHINQKISIQGLRDPFQEGYRLHSKGGGIEIEQRDYIKEGRYAVSQQGRNIVHLLKDLVFSKYLTIKY